MLTTQRTWVSVMVCELLRISLLLEAKSVKFCSHVRRGSTIDSSVTRLGNNITLLRLLISGHKIQGVQITYKCRMFLKVILPRPHSRLTTTLLYLRPTNITVTKRSYRTFSNCCPPCSFLPPAANKKTKRNCIVVVVIISTTTITTIIINSFYSVWDIGRQQNVEKVL